MISCVSDIDVLFDIVIEVFKALSGEQYIHNGAGDVKEDHDNGKLPIVWLIWDTDQKTQNSAVGIYNEFYLSCIFLCRPIEIRHSYCILG